jgi:hypothetical protein
MLLTEGFLGWLSRSKLIRLQRISLATLPRYGRMGGRRVRVRVCRVLDSIEPEAQRVRR